MVRSLATWLPKVHLSACIDSSAFQGPRRLSAGVGSGVGTRESVVGRCGVMLAPLPPTPSTFCYLNATRLTRLRAAGTICTSGGKARAY